MIQIIFIAALAAAAFISYKMAEGQKKDRFYD